ncbi:MAG: DMT family transporter [Thermodesulfobacteriota bacterium]
MPFSQLSTKAKGLLIVLPGVTVISFDALLVRLTGTSNSNIIFWRGIFMFISLFMINYFARKEPTFKHLYNGGLPAIGSAFSYGLGGVLFVSAVMFTQVANAVVIISISPLFAAILTRAFGIEKIPARTWLAIIFSICGVVTVFYSSLQTGGLLGNLIALAAALNIGGNLTLLRQNPWLDPLPLVCAGGAIMAMLGAFFAQPWTLDWQDLLILAFMGLIQMPTALVLIGTSTRYLPAPEVSLFLLIETVFAPIWVWLVLGENPPVLTFLGGGIIIITLVLHFWSGMQEPRQSPQLRS